MKRAVLERLAAVLVLAACICAECIPLLPVSYTHLTLPTICSV